MNATSLSTPRTAASLLVPALLACWLVWGSTYLAIHFALKSLPPFFQMGSRFLVAGGLLMAWVHWRGGVWPTAVQWRNAAVIGTLMLGGGMGWVASAQQHIGSGLIAWPFAKISHQNPRTFVPPMMFNNCGNMGLPLALFAFGPIGVAGMVALFTTSNLLHFTLGAFIVHKHAELKLLAKSPMVWATVIGAALGLSGTHLPDSVHAPMKMIGDCTIPVMLLSLGVRMLDVKREDFSRSLLGAAVCPLTGLLMAGIVVQYLPMNKEQIGLVYLFGALPPAVLNFLVADYYKQEPEKVASIVLVGNIASIVFIPLGLLFALK